MERTDSRFSVFRSEDDLVIDLTVGTHGYGIYHKVLVGVYDTMLVSCYGGGVSPDDARGYA